MIRRVADWFRMRFAPSPAARTEWIWSIDGVPLSGRPSFTAPPAGAIPAPEPQPGDNGDEGYRLEGKVVLGFSDGSRLGLNASDPRVDGFVKAADEITRSRGKRRFAGSRGSK